MLPSHEFARLSQEELAALSITDIDAACVELGSEFSIHYAALCARTCITLASCHEEIMQLLFLMGARFDLLEQKLKG